MSEITTSANNNLRTSNGKTTIFLCEDTVDGIFTAIYKAWEVGTSHTDVRVKDNCEFSFFEEYTEVATDLSLSFKVADSINKKLGSEVFHYTYYSCLSNDKDKASCVYHFLRKAFRIGSNIMQYLSDSTVMRIFELTRAVSNEACRFREFIRFEELSNGILSGKINPKHNVVPLIADYFSDRMHNENWIILDTQKNISAVHKAHTGYVFTYDIDEAKLLSFCGLSDKENEFQALWKRFFDTIAIEERKNYNLQRNLMPLYARKYMKEFGGD